MSSPPSSALRRTTTAFREAAPGKSLREVQDTLARVTERVAVPVIVDADTGFGNALNVQRTVRGFERAGAAQEKTAQEKTGG